MHKKPLTAALVALLTIFACPASAQTDQAVLAERMKTMQVEYQSGFHLLAAKMDADRTALEAKIDNQGAALESKIDLQAAERRAEAAELENRIILWIIGWTTSLVALAFVILPIYLSVLRRYFPGLLPDKQPSPAK